MGKQEAEEDVPLGWSVLKLSFSRGAALSYSYPHMSASMITSEPECNVKPIEDLRSKISMT